jgi:toxin ParE1/3/4
VRIFVAASAEADVESIKEYFGERNPVACDVMLGRIGDAAALLATHPRIGHPGRVTGTREFFIARTPFVLVYAIANEELTVLRVLHAQRQWPSP